MNAKESKSAISEILEKYESMGHDKKQIKDARKQYESILNNQFSSFASELKTIQEKNKKTIIEPHQIPSTYSKKAPDLYHIIGDAWGNRRDRAEEAIKEFFYIMQTYHRLKEDVSEQAAGTSASVYNDPSERKSIGDILNKMKNIVNPEVYKYAKEEYQKLQDIEKMIARDDSLRVRKDKWKIHNLDGPLGYINVEIPNRPLHVVLNRAQKEGVKGSDFALMDYGSMLHSEVLYDSKDNMAQMAPMPQEFEKTENVQAKHGNVENVRELHPVRVVPEVGRVQREQERSRCNDDHMFMLQQEIDKLTEQLNIKNTEIEDLTTRLSQAASNSLMYNNPSIADLSDKNRPTKLGERFGQLYDNEWSEAYETLKISIPSEKIVYSILADVVKDIFQYCEKALQQQIADIKHDLEKRTREPRFFYDKKSFSGIGKTDEMLSWMCEKYATEFQKGNAVYSVQGLTKIYKDYCKHRQFLNSYPGIMEKIESYVNLAVELCWLMCAQTPPMQLLFARRNDKVDKTYFRCMGHSGDKVDICIWPAVLLHDGGPVVMKGQILPL
ncbi:uncharacterized protein LOC133193446 isoform X2 [Saccostrea echinata]|uniref:uncharacterized protein LOC133193446 isoform X2 n=1 Tax=Saccostrea echinata TaxID=191078 RepID=UPI002A7F8088|nr:uncharacterized protein LOC133193446 isoform X2 [Saccostrea echinata]